MRSAIRRLTGTVCCLLLLGAPGASRAAAPQAMETLAAHRAFYRLTLASTENSGVTNASGAMEYEVIDGCTGWATQQRLDMTVLDREGGDTHTVSDYSTWESKDGQNFRFRITQSTNDDREVRAGWAELPPGKPGFAVYTAPEPRRVVLPAGTIFPMAQTEAVLAAAQKGQMFVSVPVFDGTATAAVENTFAVITSHGQVVPTNFAPLSKLPSLMVHMGYFATDTTEMLPDTLLSMRYWNNGVADGLMMNFGNFTMAGTLAQFRLLPHHC
ncbi:EipB family protein [Acidisoma sp.]|uniref:EipB family protein n=1 Tax=Acidisoma sp. TaxID=1872115 RepID=UPI003AFFE7D2